MFLSRRQLCQLSSLSAVALLSPRAMMALSSQSDDRFVDKLQLDTSRTSAESFSPWLGESFRVVLPRKISARLTLLAADDLSTARPGMRFSASNMPQSVAAIESHMRQSLRRAVQFPQTASAAAPADQHPVSSKNQHRATGFSLTFTSTDKALVQETYTISHPTFGEFSLFLTPNRPVTNSDGSLTRLYTAVFAAPPSQI